MEWAFSPLVRSPRIPLVAYLMAMDLYDDSPDAAHRSGAGARRPYVSVLFDCCRVYARVYRPPDQPYYEGRCPKCLRVLHVRVGPDGTASRFLRAE